MHKKIVSLLSLSTLVISAEVQMPPAPPSIPMSSTKTNASPCSEVPPMLFMLPPTLQEAVDACQNERGMPKKDIVQKKIASLNKNSKVENITITSISPAVGFVRAYKVVAKISDVEQEYICNDNSANCLKLSK